MRRFLRLAVATAALSLAASQARASWYEAKSKHFIIDGDVDPADLSVYARKLERFDQAVRIARNMDDPSLTDAGRLRIYFVRNADEWEALTGGGGLLGEYIGRASGSYAFVPKMKSDRAGDYNSDIIFFHEYAHHLMFQNWAAALPTWVVEGFAEFFSTAQINDDGTVVLGGAANYRSLGVYGLHHEYPLSQMLSDSGKWFTNWQIELLYSRGWLLTHYLTFENSRRGQLDKYIADIQRGESARDAATAAFGDLTRLENELDHYALRKEIPGIVVRPDPAKLGPITVNALPPGKAALMSVQMRSDYGLTPAGARFVAGKARGAAQAWPTDPFAQSTLAEAEYDDNDYAASEAAADRALASDPTHFQALIYKGRAEMALAKANPAKANWNEIRGWFAKANHIDTENAEPLMLYYQSFVLQGQQPTASAVKGLLYALVLAPQDQKLRWMAVRQQLLDGKFDDAKRTLGPIAFDPHADSDRARADKVRTAIELRDSTAGVALIDDFERDWKHV